MEDLNDKNFEEFIKKHKIAIIDFYADWCGPCQMMKPVFHEIAEKFKGKAGFERINVDNCEIAQKLGVMSIPCFIIFKNGKEVDRIVGGMHKTDFENKLKQKL